MRKIYSQGDFKALSKYEYTPTTLDLSNTSIVSMIAYEVTNEERSEALILAMNRLFGNSEKGIIFYNNSNILNKGLAELTPYLIFFFWDHNKFDINKT